MEKGACLSRSLVTRNADRSSGELGVDKGARSFSALAARKADRSSCELGDEKDHCLGAYCPNILFPYARECITSQVSRGTFPQLNLAPVNFDALFMNYLQQQTDGEGNQPIQEA